MALRLVSLVLLFPVVLANGYWASGLADNVRYIATQNDGHCGAVGGLAGLGIVLPWLFLTLGVAAAAQLIFRGRFGLSAALLVLHVMHMALLIGLLILGNGYCRGLSLFAAFPVLSGLVRFGALVAVLPLPVLILQIKAMRKEVSQEGGAL